MSLWELDVLVIDCQATAASPRGVPIWLADAALWPLKRVACASRSSVSPTRVGFASASGRRWRQRRRRSTPPAVRGTFVFRFGDEVIRPRDLPRDVVVTTSGRRNVTLALPTAQR
jgi:hypothetical protein